MEKFESAIDYEKARYYVRFLNRLLKAENKLKESTQKILF